MRFLCPLELGHSKNVRTLAQGGIQLLRSQIGRRRVHQKVDVCKPAEGGGGGGGGGGGVHVYENVRL